VDKIDVLAIIAIVKYRRDFVKRGNSPLVYKYITYRFAGHSISDPRIAYRSREEIRKNRANDPLIYLKARLVD
jgi:pyruvate dehydrogenase E1 component alpha subunit